MIARGIPIVALILSVFSAVPAFASPGSSAVAVLVSYERSHYHNSDVEQPQCFVLQSWAQCSFGTGHGNAEVNAWLHYKGGAWKFLGQGGGVTDASMLEHMYGIPAPIARRFQAKQ
jgi:hypothetical protein